MSSKTARLVLFSICLFALVVFFAPMRVPPLVDRSLLGGSVSLEIGERVQLPRKYLSGGAALRSSAPLVAQIQGDGTVTGISPGRAVITVEQGTNRGMVSVVVSGVAVRRLGISAASLSLEVGQMSGLSARINADATDRRVFWVSGDPGVATVDASGLVTAVSVGRTRIVCSTPNGLSASATVRVAMSAQSVTLSPSTAEMRANETLMPEAVFWPQGAADEVYAWRTSDSRVAEVSQQGTIRARSAGSCVVTLQTVGGLSASCSITVSP